MKDCDNKVVTVRKEGMRKRKTMEKDDDDVQENLKTTGIRNWHRVATDWKE